MNEPSKIVANSTAKAMTVATALVAATGGLSDADFATVCESIRIALKEQDRDTRHACAEGVMALESVHGRISQSAAHNACMNARAA